MSQNIKLVLGLGMPVGLNKFENRHSVGFQSVELFTKEKGVQFHPTEVQEYELAEYDCSSEECATCKAFIIRPLIHINESGLVLTKIFENVKQIPIENILLAHDDLDLPLAKVKLRSGGSAGGHNGVKSIIDLLQSPDVFRIRIGIGRPSSSADFRTFVLSQFSQDEEAVISVARRRVAKIIEVWLLRGRDEAENRFNSGQL